MKRLLLAFVLAALLPAALPAQTVPSSIAYQGKVSDANGALIGASSPVNRTAIFRIWDSPTATAVGNRKYTEQQNVTVANGEFSVLIGSGTVFGSEAKPVLATVFDGSERYLGITIDDGVAPAEIEITPRQRLVSAPFAFRATVAESVASQAVESTMIKNGAVGVAQLGDSAVSTSKILDGTIIAADLAANSVTTAQIANNSITSAKIIDGNVGGHDLADLTVTAGKIADGAITTGKLADLNVTSAKIADGNVTSAKIADSSVTSVKIADGAVTTADLANGAVTVAKLGSDVGFWIPTPLGGVRRNSNIGIWTAEPAAPIHVVDGTSSRALFTTTGTGVASSDGLAVGYDTGGFVWNHEATELRFGTSNTTRQTIAADGRMSFNQGISNNGTTYSFKGFTSDYIMILYNGSTDMFRFGMEGTAYKPGGGSFASTSDRRLKNDIANLTGSLDQLLKLRSVTFDYKDPKHGAGRQTGFIAQEMAEVFPQWVKTGPEGYLAISFTGFESQVVQALRELRTEKDAQIARLEAEVRALKETLAQDQARHAAAVTAQLDALEKRLAARFTPLASAAAGSR